MDIFTTLWTLIFSALILNLLTNTLKKFFKEPTETDRKFLSVVVWTLLPLVPVALGAAFGFTHFGVVPVWVSELGPKAGVLYYAGAGYVSNNFYAMFKNYLWAKKEIKKVEDSAVA